MNALDQIAPLSDARRDEIVAAYYRSQREPLQMGMNGLVAWNAVPDLAAEIERLKAENATLRGSLDQAESRIAEALDLASRLDPTSGHGRVRAFISDLRRALGEAVSW